LSRATDVYTQISQATARAFCKHSVKQPSYAAIASELREGESLLDVACGNGIGALWYPNRGYLGVDISAPLILVAREEHPDHHFQVVEPGPLLFGEASFDVAVCKSTLETLESAEVALALFKETIRVAKRLAMIVWYAPPLDLAEDNISTVLAHTSLDSNEVFGQIHQNRYRRAPFIEACQGHVLQITEVAPHQLWRIYK
jgi:ubiquinone/menaquinone biosynthesis C-methylase UbiE